MSAPTIPPASFTNQFFNNLFGVIASQNSLLSRGATPGFIPTNDAGEVMYLSGQNATWIGLQNRLMQKWAYEYCFPLASVVDRIAEADVSGELEFSRRKGKGSDDEATSPYAQRLKKLFQQPNPLQAWEEFRIQQTVYKKIFGFCPVLPIMPAGMTDPSYAAALINIPPWLFEAVPTGKLLFQSDINEIVDHYKISIMGSMIELEPNQIFILEDGVVRDEMSSFILPKSRLVGLDMAISNICAAMEADNVLLKKRGPIGFISHDAAATKDAVAGYLPMTKDEKNELQKSLAGYGLGWNQLQYVISRQAVKWNPMSFDIKQLGTKETVIEGARAICQRYGMPYVLFQDSDATYSNQESAHLKFFDNTIIPNSKRDMNKYEKFFQAEENNVCIEVCYDDLAIFKDDDLKEAQARKALDEALKIEYDNDLITFNEWRQALDLETIGPEGDKYASERKQSGNQSETTPGQTPPTPGQVPPIPGQGQQTVPGNDPTNQ